MVLQAQKLFGEEPFHFQLELNTLCVLIASRDENLKDCSSAKMGAVPRELRLCSHIFIYIFSCRKFMPEV